MVDLNALRKESQNDFTKINQEFDRINKGSSNSKDSSEDTRFWKLEPDKLGNATAVIRFLPRTGSDELPWVRIFSHGFQGPSGKWYIENSRTTLNEKDPVGELNSKLWASTLESNREIARKQKRRMHYISNVYIISDPKNPANEGTVKLFKYGKKIFDKIMEKAKPTFADEKPMRKVDGYANYDQSSFLEPNALLGNDEKRLTEVLAKAHPLAPFIAPTQFKSYEDLNRRLNEVLETLPENRSSGTVAKPKTAENTTLTSAKKEEEDVLSYFQGIANELES